MIELIDVYKEFGRQVILNGVSLKIEKGESFAIIGLSGTGKTVTLRHIAGLVQPDRGIVNISGKKLNGAPKHVVEELRNKMGVVFQSGALINWLSVYDNVSLPLVERGDHDQREIEKMVNDKLEMLQLLDAKNKMPAEISGGMKKRVCLARVLIRNPEIILYDEPTSGLDPVMSSAINELMLKMRNEFKVTSVVVTHDMNSAYYIADRIAFLYDGEIVQCDVPEKIRNSDNPIVKQFVTGELDGPIDVRKK